MDYSAIYDVNGAAAHLGVKPETIKYHVYKSKQLRGEVRGNSLIFTRETLDSFKANKGPAHRPVGLHKGEDRHLAAVRLWREGKSTTEIQKILGYKTVGGATRAVQYGLLKKKKAPRKR